MAKYGAGFQIDLKALGAPELERALNNLQGAGRTGIFSQAAKKAMVPVLNDIKATAPKLTGKMSKAFGRRSIKAMRGRKARGAVGARILFPTRDALGIPRDSKGYYPAAQEFGWKQRGKPPKVGEKRFVRNALYGNRSAVFSSLKRELWVSIRKVLRKRGIIPPDGFGGVD